MPPFAGKSSEEEHYRETIRHTLPCPYPCLCLPPALRWGPPCPQPVRPHRPTKSRTWELCRAERLVPALGSRRAVRSPARQTPPIALLMRSYPRPTVRRPRTWEPCPAATSAKALGSTPAARSPETPPQPTSVIMPTYQTRITPSFRGRTAGRSKTWEPCPAEVAALAMGSTTGERSQASPTPPVALTTPSCPGRMGDRSGTSEPSAETAALAMGSMLADKSLALQTRQAAPAAPSCPIQMGVRSGTSEPSAETAALAGQSTPAGR